MSKDPKDMARERRNPPEPAIFDEDAQDELAFTRGDFAAPLPGGCSPDLGLGDAEPGDALPDDGILPPEITAQACGRCPSHTQCHVTTRCSGCGEWTCLACWFACNLGPRPHGEAGRGWLEAIEAEARQGGSGAEAGAARYLHEDGGGTRGPRP
ncbi:MAG: hypothetical protein AB7V27_07125 [Candidatus Binatia bacterium]